VRPSHHPEGASKKNPGWGGDLISGVARTDHSAGRNAPTRREKAKKKNRAGIKLQSSPVIE